MKARTTLRFIALALAAVLTVGLTACNPTPSATTAPKITITDSLGTTVVFDKSPTKIISLLPSDTEILYALGAQDSVIAVAKISMYPPEVSEKTQIDTFEKTNVEAIIDMAPDAVIMGKMTQTEDQANQLRDAGIKIIIDEPQTINDIYGSIERMGVLVGKTKEAAALVVKMKGDFEAIKTEAKALAQKNIYVEISPLEFGIWTSGTGTFFNEIVDMLNMKNIFADMTSWVSVSEEQVIARDPDIILSTLGKNYESVDSIKEIVERPNWQNMKAVKGANVFWIDGDKISIPGPRLAESAREILDLLKQAK